MKDTRDMMVKDYDTCTDEELIARLRAGEREITDYLIDKYKSLVRTRARALYLVGGDHEDLIQEGMLGLFKAVRDYKPGKEASFATYARNSKWSEHVIYVGPMGCLTGFYLLTRGLTDAEALALTQESFAWMAEYDGDIPGASAVECGNYLMMDPVAARLECKAMSEVLQKLDADHMRYQEK